MSEIESGDVCEMNAQIQSEKKPYHTHREYSQEDMIRFAEFWKENGSLFIDEALEYWCKEFRVPPCPTCHQKMDIRDTNGNWIHYCMGFKTTWYNSGNWTRKRDKEHAEQIAKRETEEYDRWAK